MKTLPMSATEIAQSYRTAKNPETQVDILADLNLCSRAEMEEILAGLGLRERKEKKHKGRAVTFDTVKARLLWDEGKDDAACADALGIPVGRFREWRRREGLMKRERAKPEAKPEVKPEVKPEAKPERVPKREPEVNPKREPVSVRRLFTLLDEAVSEGYGDAPLTVEGQCFGELHLIAQRTFGGSGEMAVELQGTVL